MLSGNTVAPRLKPGVDGPRSKSRSLPKRRTPATSGAPECADNDLVVIERVVDVTSEFLEIQTTKTGQVSKRVRSARSRQHSENLGGRFKFGREQLSVVAGLKPPGTLTVDVALRRRGEADATRFQRDRSSLSRSAASMRRPAATSVCDSASAAWSAARSA